jgi:hypothetical protein
MTKDEFRSYVKQKFKSMGFLSKKSVHYKFVEEDYIVCFELYPSSYGKAYQCICGAIILPSTNFPLCGHYDITQNFQFPYNPECVLDFTLPALDQHRQYDYKCEYEKYTFDQIDSFFDANISHILMPLYNKEVVLDYFRQDWRRFSYKDPNNIVNICNKAGIDIQAVFKFLGQKHVDLICKRAGLDSKEFLASLGTHRE